MAVALPTPDQLRAVADDCGLALTDEDVTSFRGLMQGSVDAYNAVAAMPDEVPVVKYPRTPGYRPGPEENPHNAWYRKSTVKGAARGKLKGKVVALKDNIMLAGVPMMNGSATLEGYVPDFDATIVTRMLDAGAEIAGKVHCESFCMSGGSHITRTRWDIRRVARPPAAPWWSRSAKSTWRSGAIRAVRSACRPPSAAPTA
jgi:amidase